jgi:hypothetical protein
MGIMASPDGSAVGPTAEIGRPGPVVEKATSPGAFRYMRGQKNPD